MENIEHGTIFPEDEYNRALIQNVHPPQWVNPAPEGKYNLVVIGAGTAGLVTAAIAAALGAKVALIERHLMGGDCLNVGCVPSKGMIRASRVWEAVRSSGEFGIDLTGGIKYDFAAAMGRMRRLRSEISGNDSAHRYKKMGVDVFIGEGRFIGPDSVEVDGRTLIFSKAAVCTGARAASPPIPGLKEAGFLTNESVFTLTDLPRRLAVLGAGPIGCELAQAFARFGSKVFLFEKTGQILIREDADAASIVQDQMKNDGVEFVFDATVTRIEAQGKKKIVSYEVNGERNEVVVDEILIGLGRTPNVEGLDLEKAGVDYDHKYGVKVNEKLQTSNPRIFAAGDICSRYKFTHTADAAAQILIQNALFPHPFGLGFASTDSLIVPWCTYTDPEIAHVGLYEADAKDKGVAVETFTVGLKDVDRAILDGETQGFARVHVKKGTDKILGATIVAAHAGDLISEFTVAIKGGIGLGTISNTIHPYPTQAEVIKKVALAWRKSTFTDKKKNILKKWFTWTR
ncbi:MAG: mercuric reductase [Nitrospirae bacterium]|nr:mercuric reductase [Nitrospirota bacterium]